MNYKFLIFTGTMCICSCPAFSAVLEDVSENIPVTEPAQVEQPPQLGASQRVGIGGKKKISRSVFDQFKIPEQKQRTCQEALDQSIADGSGILDLSATTDFAQNGWAAIEAFLRKIKETNSFGTYSKNLSVDLSKTNVTPEILSMLMERAKLDGLTLILNLYYNKTIGDETIDVIGSFSNIYSIILRGTNISDVGIAKFNAILEMSGIGVLHSVDVSETNVSPGGAKVLAEQMQKAIEAWKIQNPTSTYNIKGAGVIYEESSFVKVPRKRQGLKPNLAVQNTQTPSSSTIVASPSQPTEQGISLESSTEIISDQQPLLEEAPESIALNTQEVLEPAGLNAEVPITDPGVGSELVEVLE
ncbi:MAG: hypothetical protein LBU35_03045 [Holosporales bacterium]|jgi:hypothetical protein|nr:hypothetical protein [Holosporales bacterium]